MEQKGLVYHYTSIEIQQTLRSVGGKVFVNVQ